MTSTRNLSTDPTSALRTAHARGEVARVIFSWVVAPEEPKRFDVGSTDVVSFVRGLRAHMTATRDTIDYPFRLHITAGDVVDQTFEVPSGHGFALWGIHL